MVALILGLSTTTVSAGFRFVVWGDITDYLDYVTTNAAQIRSLPVQPKLNLLAGDLHRYAFTPELGEAMRTAMDGDAVGPSGLFETMFPVRGNHELVGGALGTSNWQAYYAVSNRVELIGGSNYTCMPGYDRLTYSFDYQGCHFAGMDIPGDVTLVQSN